MHLNGLISLGSEWDEILIGDTMLSSEAEDLDGKIARLNYYLSNRPIDPDKVVEDFLRTFYEGETEANASYIHGSSWTGVYARHDTLEIGGHDIIEELKQHVGEYCYLIIELLT